MNTIRPTQHKRPTLTSKCATLGWATLLPYYLNCGGQECAPLHILLRTFGRVEDAEGVAAV